MKRTFLYIMFVLWGTNSCLAQAVFVLNGAYANISNSAYLVIDNPATTAITRTSGHIISEAENSIVKWNIGTTAGTYTVPFGYSITDYIPVTFIKTAGTGSGSFLFSTYRTATWQDRKSTRLNSSHIQKSRMPSSA